MRAPGGHCLRLYSLIFCLCITHPPCFPPCSFLGGEGDTQAAKRRRVEGGAAEEDEDADEALECTGTEGVREGWRACE